MGKRRRILWPLLAIVLCGCGGQHEQKGPRADYGSGQGRVYDRGGLPADLGILSVGSKADGRANTNTSVKGTAANVPRPVQP